MKKSHLFITTGLAGALALAGAACSSTSMSTNPTGGGGSSGGVPPGYLALPSSSSGFVQDATSGVVGAWFVYADSVGKNASVANGDDHANSDCVLKGGFTYPAQCSQVLTPPPGQPFPPYDADTSAMCTSGVAAQVISGASGSLDWSDLWGAGIGLDFNNPGGDAGAAGYADLSAYKGIYFDFYAYTGPGSNMGGIPANYMRVNFPFNGEHGGTDSPYWMGATMAASPLKPPTGGVQHVEVDWSDVGGPMYLAGQTPAVNPANYPFQSNAIQSIEFQVFTNQNATDPYAFCVANLALIPK